MYTQTLYKVIEPIKINTIKRLNKSKKWEYGYNKEHDIIVISKNGQIGEIYEIQNLRIALPKSQSVCKKHNKWIAKDYPKELQKLKTIFDWKELPQDFKNKWHEYIEDEFTKREQGYWFRNKGIDTYITGTHYMYLQWTKIDVGKPEFREANRLFYIFWEACKADSRSYGMCYLKNRRSGFSFMASAEAVNLATISSDARYGILSKSGADAKKCSLIKWYPYRLTTHSFLNQYKTVWIDPKPNWHIVYPLVNLPDVRYSRTKGPRSSKGWTPPSIGRTPEITRMTERNYPSLSTMKRESGRGQTTSSTTGGLRKQR